MLRANSVIRRSELADRVPFDSITLDRASRYRRRLVLMSDSGMTFLLDLPEATHLADGDALLLDDGCLVLVTAAAEDLLEIHAHDPLQLARIAWHIGNRHTPCEVTVDALYIRPDHVLADMVTGIGGRVQLVCRPFEPEGGAYGGKGPAHAGHHHGHGAPHHHDHGCDHNHGPVQPQPPARPFGGVGALSE